MQIATREYACNMLLQLKNQKDRLGREEKNKTAEDDAESNSDSDNNNFDKNNFGFKMLNQMGWTAGKGLGKEESGISEFIKVKRRTQRAGIGAESGEECLEANTGSIQDVDDRKEIIRKITLKRYLDTGST